MTYDFSINTICHWQLHIPHQTISDILGQSSTISEPFRLSKTLRHSSDGLRPSQTLRHSQTILKTFETLSDCLRPSQTISEHLRPLINS